MATVTPGRCVAERGVWVQVEAAVARWRAGRSRASVSVGRAAGYDGFDAGRLRLRPDARGSQWPRVHGSAARLGYVYIIM